VALKIIKQKGTNMPKLLCYVYVQDSDLLVCDSLLLGELYSTFQSTVVTSSSGSCDARRNFFSLKLLKKKFLQAQAIKEEISSQTA
jgi:hypothetical protein